MPDNSNAFVPFGQVVSHHPRRCLRGLDHSNADSRLQAAFSPIPVPDLNVPQAAYHQTRLD
jgi:hypothetical protein